MDGRTLFCINSMLGSATMDGYLARNDKVSLEVLKLFISINLTFKPNSSRILMTCLAVRSKKVFSPFTFKRDLALSKPIEVPRPPFSFNTTVCWNQKMILN